MADNIGLGYEQYRRIESGKVLIKTEYLYTIACMLRVSVDYLLYGTENWSGSQKLKEILNSLTPEDVKRAEKVLSAVFE